MVSRWAWARIVAALLLSALTLALFAWDGRLRPVGRNMLSDPDFSQGGNGWTATPGTFLLPDLGPAIALVTRPSRQFAYVSQEVPDPSRFEYLRLSAEVRLENIVARDKDWQRAGIVLRPFDRSDQRLRFWPYEVFLGDGSGDWQRRQKVLPVSDATGRMTLYVYNAGESGRFLVRGLTLEAVAETGVTRLARYALIVGWAGLVLSAAAAMFARTGTWSRWLLLLLGALILASTLAPQPGLIYLVGDSAHQAFGVVDATVARLSPESPPTARPSPPAAPPAATQDTPTSADGPPPAGREGDDEAAMGTASTGEEAATVAGRDSLPATAAEDATGPSPRPSPTLTLRRWLDSVLYEGRPILGMDKQVVAHLTAFALFAGLLALSASGIASLPMAGYLLLAAASSEVLQSFVVSRGVEPADLAVNTVGILIGMAAGLVARRWRQGG